MQVSLAGAGYIAVVHALAAQAAGMQVRAVASRGGTSARHLAGGIDARRVQPEQLPDGADVLIVATPPEFHEELTLQGLSAGAKVLVEKPLTTTLASADRMVAAADGASARCAENLLHAPLWQEFRRIRPTLGTLGHLSLRTLQPPPDWGHFTGALPSGGVLFDLGPHPIALALDAAGEIPSGVSAELSSTRDDGADDDATVRIDFPSGLVAELRLSWTTADPEWSVQAASPDGVLLAELLPEVTLEHDVPPPSPPPPPPPGPSSRPPPPSPPRGRAGRRPAPPPALPAESSSIGTRRRHGLVGRHGALEEVRQLALPFFLFLSLLPTSCSSMKEKGFLAWYILGMPRADRRWSAQYSK